MTSGRIALHILLVSVVAAAGHAQQSSTSNSAAPGSSTSAPVKKALSPGDRVILKVGDVKVTQAEFESRIEDIEPEADPDKAGDVDKDRRKLGDDYASVLMLSQQAVASHLDSSPEVSRQLAIERLQILSDAQFASLMRQSVPSLEEISQYYSAHPSDYDRVRIRRLFIWKSGGSSKNVRGLSPDVAKARGDAVLQASASDATKLAEAFKDSDDGMLDAAPLTFSRGELPPRMEKVAFTAKEGEWAQADDTPDALILLQLMKRDRQTLVEVSSLIQQRLQAQKMKAQLDNLKKKTGIWMDEEYFGPAVAAGPSHQPPSRLGKSAAKEETTNEDARRK